MFECRPALRRLFACLLMFCCLGWARCSAWAQQPEEIVERARQAAAANNNQEAARLFEQAITITPFRRGELLTEYADQLAYSGRPAEAVPLYRERLTDRTLDAATRQRLERSLAFALFWSSQFDQAIDAWQRIIESTPNDAQARTALVEAIIGAARVAAGRGASQEAASLFERAINLDPAKRQEIGREYADQLAYSGRPVQAIPVYRAILNRQDLSAEERQRSTRNLAFSLLWGSQFQEAAEAWESILSGNPDDAEGRKALSDALVGSARQAAERSRNADAVTFFRRAIEAAPQRRQEFLQEYADQTAYAGQPAQAIPLYREALRDMRRPDEQQRLRRGLAFALLWSNQFPEAANTFEEVLRQAPDDAQARQGLADARAGAERRSAQTSPAPPSLPASPADAAITAAREAAGRGANKEAVSLFERAMGLDPARRSQVGREYADQLAFSGEPGKAVPVYREVLSRKDLSPAEQRQTSRSLAFALLWSSRFQEAIEAWQAILQANRDDAEARKALSDAFVGAARQTAERARNANAAELFRKAIDAEPQRRQELLPEYADQLAYAGEPARAVPLYREALREGARTEAERRRLRRGLAFALLWSNQFREAIAAWQAILKENPRDNDARKALSDALVGAARETAGKSRNAEAAALFERALAVTPGRRRELLREYAEQVLYSGRPSNAVPLFQEVLQRTDLNRTEKRAAQLGFARALAWGGQQAAAIPVFTEILQAFPSDVEALIGRGNALNDITRHKEALADFEQVLTQQPNNVDAIRGAATAERSMGLPRAALARLEPLLAGGDQNAVTLFIAAQARREMGRPDLSQSFAEAVLARKPGDEGARRLLDQLFDDRRPLTRIEAWHARRSDDLAISSLQFSHTLTFDNGLTAIGPQARILRFRGEDFPSVDIYGIGVAGRSRVNDFFEVKSSLFLNIEDEGPRYRENRRGDQDVALTHETTLSLIPSDLLRFDLNVARRYADENTRSIVNDILANDVGLSVDITPDNATRLSGRALYSHYSDGNERVWGQIDFAKRLTAEPYLWLGARYTTFDFAKVLDNGYWNPDRYQSLEASVHFYGTLVERLTFDLQGGAGYGWSEPGNGGFVSSATARLAYEFDPQASFALYANHLISYARTSEDGEFRPAQDDEPFSRWSLGAQFRLRW